ncbi:CHY zinc finger protein [Rummeliibacillus stabekisii]|uniref:CHY zinc finger protein n=1 Tax=Rummeliibacillus stabekisii TaxID=241244 RepID=UPI00203A69D9|nr:CHY zinc finger protein [Rummeliibacillus stabekisii]MCM3316775.1 CHY zinc finger protein [Rummeliibacillus stabekisii]
MRVLENVIDQETRCTHYHTVLDVIAIKFACCGEYYPCYKCHDENADHPIQKWTKEMFDVQAILCGVCKTELTIHQYMNSNHCPSCNAKFNDGCIDHYPIYFDMD